MRSIGLRFGWFCGFILSIVTLSVCVVRLFSRVIKFVLFRHGFVRGMVHMRYVLLRITTISFHGCVVVSGACGASTPCLLSFASVWWCLQRPADACTAKDAESTAMTTRAATTTTTAPAKQTGTSLGWSH